MFDVCYLMTSLGHRLREKTYRCVNWKLTMRVNLAMSTELPHQRSRLRTTLSKRSVFNPSLRQSTTISDGREHGPGNMEQELVVTFHAREMMHQKR